MGFGISSLSFHFLIGGCISDVELTSSCDILIYRSERLLHRFELVFVRNEMGRQKKGKSHEPNVIPLDGYTGAEQK